MNTQPPHRPGSPDTSPPQAELEAVRAALEPDYEVLQELGRGGMAVVYRAREIALDREVAIKVLPAGLAMDNDFVERFQREARTAGQLEHPNIVPIYRVGRAGSDGRMVFFVMKMLRGQSLSAVLRGRGKLAVDEIRRIMKETASALGFAAKKGVVHRDIKPDNILLDDEGRCVVTDFGIAKTSTGPHTAAGTSMGTPRYMSPEHAQGTPVDVRSDIYSLGVVAYQCLAGMTPFDADNPFAILYKHINETLPRPTLTTPDEWAIYGVIEKCLSKKPEQRYQTTDDLLVALGGEATSANTLTAAVPLRISAMVATEVITTSMKTQWYTPLGMRDRFVMLADKWHMKPEKLGLLSASALAFVVFLIALTAGNNDAATPDSTLQLAGNGRTTGATTSAIGPVTPLNAPGNLAVPPGVGATPGVAPGASLALDTISTKVPGGPTAPSTKAASAATTKAAAPPRTRPRPDQISKCPAVGSAALTKMIGNPVLLVDSIVDHKQGDTLRVRYDICGYRSGTPIETVVTLRKIRQSRLKRAVGAGAKPVEQPFLDVATNSRQRRMRTFELAGFSGGTYSAEVLITDNQGRKLEVKREFQLIEK